MNINLHIERLVLDGLPIEQHEANLIQAIVETELASLLMVQEPGARSNFVSGALPRVTAPPIQLTSHSPAHVGEQIARAVYGGIGK
jgi:hypothetical protein